MKKMMAAVGAVLLACALTVFAACSAVNVDGKTFTFDRCEIEGTVGDLTQEQLDEVETAANAAFSGLSMTFKEGKVTMAGASVDYVQVGSVLTIGDVQYTVRGNTIIGETSEQYEFGDLKIDVTVTIHFISE